MKFFVPFKKKSFDVLIPIKILNKFFYLYAPNFNQLTVHHLHTNNILIYKLVL